MEEKNEILSAMREGFARVDEQFLKLRSEFSTQLDGVSDGLHHELRTQLVAQRTVLGDKIDGVGIKLEKLDSKLDIVAENVANVMQEIRRYHDAVESPLETRVTKLEARTWLLETKK